NYPASGDSGIPKSISDLFATFSALSANPNDTSARQLVFDRARQVSLNFNSTAASLGNTLADARQQVSASVDSINRLAGLIRDFNTSPRNSSGILSDPNVDAKLHAALEQLSAFANIQTLRQSDGRLTIL